MNGEYDWMNKTASERNALRAQKQAVAKMAPVLWANIANALERAIRHYRGLDELPVEFSGPANNTMVVIVYESEPKKERGPERERLTIVFNERDSAIEVHSSLSEPPRIFPIDLDSHGFVSLMHEGKPLPVKDFIALVLKEPLFPG